MKPITKHKNQYIRKGTYPIQEVFDFMDKYWPGQSLYPRTNERFQFHGEDIKPYSLRMAVFKIKGCKCAGCGIEGSFFAMEKLKYGEDQQNTEKYHLNLYAIDKDGNEVLMTKDHIIPYSGGGSTNLDNMQTMCKICNGLKGHKIL